MDQMVLCYVLFLDSMLIDTHSPLKKKKKDNLFDKYSDLPP